MLFCSIVASNFLAHARVLAESLSRHHPEAELDLLVVDEVEKPPPAGEPFRRIGLDEAGLSRAEFHRRVTMNALHELISSLKPSLVGAAIERSREPVVLLDADMLVLGPLDDVFELAARHAIVLSPHATVPLPFEPGGLGPEQTFIRAGVFNGGFLGLSRAARDFVRWWHERSARDCVYDLDRGIHSSQAWLSLVPALFDHCVLRDRGVNLTGHGLGGDDIAWRDGRPSIEGVPLRLFHFAGGFQPRSGELGGPRSPASWPANGRRPGIARLCEEYGRLLIEAGFDETIATPWRYGTLPDGTPVDWAMRLAYRDGLRAAERHRAAAEPPNPFEHGAAAFTGWLCEPGWDGSAVSRYLAAVRSGRRDLVAAFPRVPGADEPALLRWAAGKYPSGRLPEGLPTAAAAS